MPSLTLLLTQGLVAQLSLLGLSNNKLFFMQLVFATHNKHKVSEIEVILPSSIKLLTLDDIGCLEEIPETADTLSGNALQKAMYVFEKYKCDCFADDTGLEIKALDGRPGVYSARY